MSPLLFRIHQKFKISFLSYQKLNKNYDWVKIKLFLGNSTLENIQRMLCPKHPAPQKKNLCVATTIQIIFLK